MKSNKVKLLLITLLAATTLSTGCGSKTIADDKGAQTTYDSSSKEKSDSESGEQAADGETASNGYRHVDGYEYKTYAEDENYDVRLTPVAADESIPKDLRTVAYQSEGETAVDVVLGETTVKDILDNNALDANLDGWTERYEGWTESSCINASPYRFDETYDELPDESKSYWYETKEVSFGDGMYGFKPCTTPELMEANTDEDGDSIDYCNIDAFTLSSVCVTESKNLSYLGKSSDEYNNMGVDEIANFLIENGFEDYTDVNFGELLGLGSSDSKQRYLVYRGDDKGDGLQMCLAATINYKEGKDTVNDFYMTYLYMNRIVANTKVNK